MNYYNPETKEEKSFSDICAMYHASFRSDSSVIEGTWYIIHETDMPPSEDGFRFEPGEIQLVDGVYTRTWNKVPLTAEEEQSVAYAESMYRISVDMAIGHAQTASFGTADLQLFAKAGLFSEWAPDIQYKKGYRLVCDGVVYEVQQDVLSLENQPPFARGMLAIYRPISVDPDTGEEPDGSKEHPFIYLNGMDVERDKYYSYNDKLYLAKSDMPACVWPPDTEGLWQWELVV